MVAVALAVARLADGEPWPSQRLRLLLREAAASKEREVALEVGATTAAGDKAAALSALRAELQGQLDRHSFEREALLAQVREQVGRNDRTLSALTAAEQQHAELQQRLVDAGVGAEHAEARLRQLRSALGDSEAAVRQLRGELQRELGDKFDMRAFHRALLEGGGIPVAMLPQVTQALSA